MDFHIRYRNQVAEFTIADTGVGIHPEDQARILKPFERVRNGESPVVTGTGLGLTIAYLLAEIMGGELRMQSEPGKGSRFTVSLLLSWVDSDHRREAPARRITGYTGPRRSVMVVDDEPVHRGLIGDLLIPMGFSLVEAQSAEDCLALVQHQRPDLFLLDVTMPGMNGLALAEQLRARGVTAPIVMLSADAKERHLKPGDAPHAHHNAYLVKPLVNQKLFDTMARLLPLEWRYDERPNNAASAPGILASDGEQPLPEHPLLAELLAYARIGYRSGVHRTLDRMASEAVVPTPRIEKFRQLADTMRFEQLSEALEQKECT